MKIKYLFTGVLISMLAFMSCEDPDDLARTGSENVTGLTITGCLASDESTTYSAIVDEASNTITIQVPYYISDTEKIQGDLTQMKVSASLPVGAKFSPSISGIRDLVSGFQSTLVKEDGSKITYTFKAAYVKSKLASISKVELTDYSRATIRIVEPESTGGTGKIIIYKTSSAIDAALKSAALTVSPWATIESSSLDPATGIIDLSNQPTITVIAQNGTDAMELLKQKEYQILVTDLNLDGYNGDKILSYVNQKFPDTICMLYTNSISAVQLGFYLNKRDVFRVFLRPVNFRQEFMQALEEAYELYDLKKHDRDSRQERLKQLEDNRKAIAEIEKIIENQNGRWKDFEIFADRLLGFTMERYGTAWNVEQRNQYFAKEKKLLKAMCENPNTHNIARAQNEAEVLMK